MNRTFDRLPSFDEKSKLFPVRTLFTPRTLKRIPSSRRWAYVQLDQLSEGACTGFSATMEAAATPTPVFGMPAWRQRKGVSEINRTAREVYYRARQIDEWPGEDYDGSSVLAAVKAGKERGWWSEYRWALGPGVERAAEDVIMSIRALGPVMIGSYWYEDMFEADSSGFLHATGSIVGGHAFLLTGYSRTLDAVWTPNSWGGFGQGYIGRDDLMALLDFDGEACIPTVRHRPT